MHRMLHIGLTSGLPDMSCCWDLDTLIAGSQPQGQYDALERLRLHFKSQVDAGTHWPDFNYVEKSWPSQKETQRQYRVFRAILTEQKKHHCWEQVEQCHVLLVAPPRLQLRLLTALFKVSKPCFDSSGVMCIIDTICRMLFQPPEEADFAVRPQCLECLHGSSWDLLKAGEYVRLLRGPFAKRWALVTHVTARLDVQKVAASVMLDPSLHCYCSAKSGKRTHCWHVAYMLALSCTSQAASSSCERIGSYLHDMSDGETRMAAARIIC